MLILMEISVGNGWLSGLENGIIYGIRIKHLK